MGTSVNMEGTGVNKEGPSVNKEGTQGFICPLGANWRNLDFRRGGGGHDGNGCDNVS